MLSIVCQTCRYKEIWRNVCLVCEKQNARKLVRTSCVDISGSIDKSGLFRHINRSTFFQCSNIFYTYSVAFTTCYYSMISWLFNKANIARWVRIVSSSNYFFQNHFLFRSSHQRCSMKKGVLRNFTKFTGKHLCQSLFFNKVTGLAL